ncbi:MerR family transcriptional regulator [Robinsoniella sp. RHS]|uniref:MerR family transcriptional regulator n=1 Tax=Robinsoniella sp. RHS TaxID=1504536 RepID=UPI00064AE039
MFTIGEFSKLCCISARMLRHYDSIGLLHPAATGADNGYRYYKASQAKTLHMIEKLKRYGFTLSEIKVLLELTDDALYIQIQLQHQKIKDQIYSLNTILSQMEQDLSLTKEKKTMKQNQYHVITMDTPAQNVFGIRRTINIDADSIHQLFANLHQEMDTRGLKPAGAFQLFYLNEEFSHENVEVEAQVPVNSPHPDIRTIPPTLCAAVTHYGSHQNLHQAYGAILNWLADHPEYQISGPGIERFIRDEHSASSADDLETGILFPLVKRK